MSRKLPPTQPEQCLILSRKSKYRGGTIIAEDVWTLEEHRRRLANPDAYRPSRCGHCGKKVLHVHDYPERRPLGMLLMAAIRVIRFICAHADCRATWRVLPAWLARHLWWAWKPIERATMGGRSGASTVVTAEVATPPAQTVRRWLGRLVSSAQQAVVLMGSRGAETLQAVTAAVGLNATRQELVEVYGDIVAIPHGQHLGAVAAVLDRLERGIRLM